MKTQITLNKSKCRFIFGVLTFIFLFFHQNLFSQKVQSILTESWKNEVWENSVNEINTYDNGYLVNFLVQNWNGHSWENFFQSFYDNNPDGTPHQVISQIWNGDSEVWEDSQRIIYGDYVSGGKPLGFVVDYWDGGWVPTSKVINTYDESGLLTKNVTQSYVYTDWVNAFQIDYVYYSNGNVDYSIKQSWDQISGEWVDSQNTIHTYDSNNNEISLTMQIWSGTAWLNLSRVVNGYWVGNVLMNSVSQDWDSSISDWKDVSRKDFTYNEIGSLYQEVEQYKDESRLVWVNLSRKTYDYGLLGIDRFHPNEIAMVYPIPAIDNLIIKINQGVDNLPFSIFDQNGRICGFGVLNNEETSIDINQLASGVYFISLNQEKNQTFKFVKK